MISLLWYIAVRALGGEGQSQWEMYSLYKGSHGTGLLEGTVCSNDGCILEKLRAWCC